MIEKTASVHWEGPGKKGQGRAGDHSGLWATPAFFLNGKAVDVVFGVEKPEAAVQAAMKVA